MIKRFTYAFLILGLVVFIETTGLGQGSTPPASSVYSLSFTNADGGAVNMNSYLGKKTLFIIVPVDVADSVKVDEIAAFNTRYGDTVRLVGILSKEDGYVDSNMASIKAMYANKGVAITLTEGMMTKTEAGTNQGSLMKWLTHQSLNKRFELNAGGVGQKFFADEAGKLYSVLIAQTGLDSEAVERNVKKIKN